MMLATPLLLMLSHTCAQPAGAEAGAAAGAGSGHGGQES